MAKYKSEIIEDKKVWEAFVLSHNPGTFLQSWDWGEVNVKEGSKIFRLGFYKDSTLVGICLIIKESAKRGPHLIVPAGPIIDWQNSDIVDLFIKTIKALAIYEHCWFVRVRPEILSTKENQKLFNDFGFISAPMHLHAENTWILNIDKPEDQILSGMRKTTRYLVKKGEKSGRTIEKTDDPNVAKKLFELQKETARRHKFVGFPEKLFRNEIDIFGKDNKAHVFVCKKDKRTLAMAIIIFYGDTAYYHFSGSVSGHNETPFSYFLQWQIIKEAKKRGIKYYNFWGIAPNNDPSHRFAGVTMFKTGFGGERIDWLHAHDFPVAPQYWLTYFFETIRKVLRRL
jgi:peptidoglycan pentaglycine glycine transferase (the first glycine)